MLFAHELWSAVCALTGRQLWQAMLKDFHPITPHIVEHLQHFELAKALNDVAFSHRAHQFEHGLFHFANGPIINRVVCKSPWLPPGSRTFPCMVVQFPTRASFFGSLA